MAMKIVNLHTHIKIYNFKCWYCVTDKIYRLSSGWIYRQNSEFVTLFETPSCFVGSVYLSRRKKNPNDEKMAAGYPRMTVDSKMFIEKALCETSYMYLFI